MEYRELGRSGMQISSIGLGCWAMGGAMWGETDDAASVAAIQHALDLGVNFIDTAPVYGFGHSEVLVGRAIRGRRDEVVLATKCGPVWDASGAVGIDTSRINIINQLNESLKRLQVDAIDLYQVHWPDPQTPIEETALTLAELQQDGKIKAIGVSNYSVAQMQETMRFCRLDSLQPPYNMFQRDIETEVLPFCREHSIGVVSYGPMHQGILTGKFYFDGIEPTDKLRREHSEMQEPKFSINRDALTKIKEIADARDVTLGELAINWVLCQPGITSAICGARNPKQVGQNVAAAGFRLTGEELLQIDSILVEREARLNAAKEAMAA